MPIIAGINVSEQQLSNPRIRKAYDDLLAAQEGRLPGTEIQAKPVRTQAPTGPRIQVQEIRPEQIFPPPEQLNKKLDRLYDIVTTSNPAIVPVPIRGPLRLPDITKPVEFAEAVGRGFAEEILPEKRREDADFRDALNVFPKAASLFLEPLARPGLSLTGEKGVRAPLFHGQEVRLRTYQEGYDDCLQAGGDAKECFTQQAFEVGLDFTIIVPLVRNLAKVGLAREAPDLLINRTIIETKAIREWLRGGGEEADITKYGIPPEIYEAYKRLPKGRQGEVIRGIREMQDAKPSRVGKLLGVTEEEAKALIGTEAPISRGRRLPGPFTPLEGGVRFKFGLSIEEVRGVPPKKGRIMYHGGDREGIEQVLKDKSFRSDKEIMDYYKYGEGGLHLGLDPETGFGYSLDYDRGRKGGRAIKVLVPDSLKLRDGDDDVLEEYRRVTGKSSLPQRSPAEQAKANGPGFEKHHANIDAIKELGYDGIEYSKPGEVEAEVLIFDPKKIEVVGEYTVAEGQKLLQGEHLPQDLKFIDVVEGLADRGKIKVGEQDWIRAHMLDVALMNPKTELYIEKERVQAGTLYTIMVRGVKDIALSWSHDKAEADKLLKEYQAKIGVPKLIIGTDAEIRAAMERYKLTPEMVIRGGTPIKDEVRGVPPGGKPSVPADEYLVRFKDTEVKDRASLEEVGRRMEDDLRETFGIPDDLRISWRWDQKDLQAYFGYTKEEITRGIAETDTQPNKDGEWIIMITPGRRSQRWIKESMVHELLHLSPKYEEAFTRGVEHPRVFRSVLRETLGTPSRPPKRIIDDIFEEALEVRKAAMTRDVDLKEVNAALKALRDSPSVEIAEQRLRELRRVSGDVEEIVRATRVEAEARKVVPVREPGRVIDLRPERKTYSAQSVAGAMEEAGFKVNVKDVEKFLSPDEISEAFKPFVEAKTGELEPGKLGGLLREAVEGLVSRMRLRARSIARQEGKMVREAEPKVTMKPKFVEQINAKMIQERFLKEVPSRIITTTEKAQLKFRLVQQARGAKIAAKVTKQELEQRFREQQTTAEEVRQVLIDYIKDVIELPGRGKFLQPLAKDMTKKQLWRVYTRVGKEATAQEVKDLRTEIEKYKDVPTNVAVEGKKRIEDLLGGIDFRRFTSDDARRIKSAAEFLAKNEVNPELKARIEKELSGLAEKAETARLSVGELRTLEAELNRLKHQYQLKEALQNKYDGRKREAAIEALVSSTRPLSKTEFGMYSQVAYPGITADLLDGLQNFKGENVKFTKGLFRADVQATGAAKALINETVDRIREVMPSIADLSVDKIHEKMGPKITLHLMMEQEAWDQAQQIIDAQKWTGVPKLSDEERRVLGVLRAPFEKLKGSLAAVYEEDTGVIFRKVDRYWPIKYESDGPIFTPESVINTRHLRVRPFHGFTFERKPDVIKAPRTDFLEVLDEAIKEQLWYTYVTPQTLNIKPLVTSDAYKAALGEAGGDVQLWWLDYLDSVARRGWSAKAQFSPFLRGMNMALVDATLAYKITSIVMQPFTTFPIMGHMSTNYGSMAALEALEEITAALIMPGRARQIISGSEALKQRAGGEVVVAERLDAVRYADSAWRRLVKGGLKLLVKADVRTAAGVQKALENVLTKYGAEDPKAESEYLTELLAGSSHVTMRPPILTRGDFWKTVFAFQSYFLSQSGNVLHTVIRAGFTSGELKKSFNALIGLGIIMMGYIAEEATRDFIANMSGKDIEKQDPLAAVTLGLVEEFPLFGRMASSLFTGQDYDIPLMRMAKNLFKGTRQLATGKTPESQVRGGLKAAEAGIALGAGIALSKGLTSVRPVGLAQIFDILEGIFQESSKGRGEFERSFGGGGGSASFESFFK